MDHAKQEPRSLIMCVTPLQMLIAEKIIHLNGNEQFDLVVLALNDNQKYRYYYNRLKEICDNSFYYIPRAGLTGFLYFLKHLKKSNINKNYNNLYLASIDARHFQYIISKNTLANVFTFDDGTANIIPSSIYYSNSTEPSKLKKIIWRSLGVKYYIEDIKVKSKKHYTIYRDAPNIINKLKFIALLPQLELNEKKISNDKTVKFYLGQPLSDIEEKFDHNFVEEKLKKIEIDYYFSHPREIEYPKGNFEIVDSILIFEDFILTYLLENPEVKIEVYSFISSALLNISSLPKVSVIYIIDLDLFNRYEDFYYLAKDSFNIDFIFLE
ncbi:glycosyltransferase family 52 [Acinetobacter johnsonii]|uniref:glycosyltransferase family 52 n=1 Tax=Acinetobacter johnsonii TaxID=40214 RepID=UPI0032B4BB0B